MKAVEVAPGVIALRHKKESEDQFLKRADQLHEQVDPVARKLKNLRKVLQVSEERAIKARAAIEELLKENPDYA